MGRTTLVALMIACAAAPAFAQKFPRRTLPTAPSTAAPSRRSSGACRPSTPSSFQASKKATAEFNQVVYWSRPVGWKNQTLTPNPDTIYLFPIYDTKTAGPMVLEIPPADTESSFTGSIDDGWQVALEDVGPAGVDKGAGGKYLILPPGYAQTLPDGFITLQSSTYAGFACAPI